MLVPKASLYKALRTIEEFDVVGSPFVGMQWAETLPLFHRSGPGGFLESIGYKPGPADLVVSLAHFRSTLQRFEEDAIEMEASPHGVLTLSGANSGYGTTLQVHTIRPGITWAKTHDPGPRTVQLDHTAFQGINTSPFPLASPPVLRRKRLLLCTTTGVVIMRSQVGIEAYPYPREGFLRTISGLPVEDLYLTHNGYWAAKAGGFQTMVSGHRTGDTMFALHDRSADDLAELPAPRLTHALSQAAAIAGKASRVSLSPSSGVRVRDPFGNEGVFSLGETKGWSSFVLPSTTALTIADALRQSREEVAKLQRVDQQTLRITRGDWEVSFRYFEADSA